MHRREMIKLSGLALAAAGLPASTRSFARSPRVHEPANACPREFSRKRPACLDLVWGQGTGMIWMAGESLFYENPRNRFMRFRRSFDLATTPVHAELRLFADTHYIAWLNGEELGRGPGRSDPTWALFDSYTIADRLKRGANHLAVLTLFHGFGTGGRESLMQALLAHLEMQWSDGTRQFVVSDRSWRASPAPHFVRPTPRLHATLGCMEVQNRAAADPAWEQPAYDDSAWAHAEYIKPDLNVTPWYHFAPDPLPARTLTRLDLRPAVTSSVAAFAAPAIETLGQVRPATDAATPTSLPVRLHACRDDQPHVLTIDLGRPECGYFSLAVDGPAGAIIDVLCGELLVGGRLPQPGTARVHTTRFVLRDGVDQLEPAFNWLAFRYAQLWIWTPGPLTVHRFGLRQLSLPLGPAGHFSCSDSFLNRLDAACGHTLRLCVQDGIVDSSSREQQQWIGDGRFTAITLHHRLPAGIIHRRLIEQIGQGIDWAGSLVPRFPTGNRNVPPIPLYSLQWVLTFRDYHWFTADESLAQDWWPMIQHALRWFTAFERNDGLLERLPHWMYVDLGEGSDAGRVPTIGTVNTTLNLHYCAACRYAAELARGWQDQCREVVFRERADRLAAAISRVLWDSTAGAYRDSLDETGRLGSISEGTNAHALMHLEPPGSERAEQILRRVFGRASLNPIRASPFTMNAVFDALGRHRRADLAVAMLPLRYAAQVESGSMWEHWNTHHIAADGTPTSHSLSHAWGAGALAFFVNTLAGIRPAAAGWRQVRIQPQPAGLTQAEASVVTPAGTIRSGWRIAGPRFTIEVSLPAGVTGICELPDRTEHFLTAPDSVFTCTV